MSQNISLSILYKGIIFHLDLNCEDFSSLIIHTYLYPGNLNRPGNKYGQDLSPDKMDLLKGKHVILLSLIKSLVTTKSII